MNRLAPNRRAIVLNCLVEGISVASTTRLTGVAKQTILNLLVDAGQACTRYQDMTLRELPCTRIECDEIWSFVYAKRKNAPFAKRPPREAGDIWTWVAMCADTKLIPSWRVGDRTTNAALSLMRDLAPRLCNRVQLTTDGHSPYLEAVEDAFGSRVDYAQIIKMYSDLSKAKDHSNNGNLPDDTDFIRKFRVSGKPDEDLTSTSYVERQNLTMRMGMRRFTRRSNGFSKKAENHAHAVALHVMHYNFCRIHESLRVTPAMEAGVTDKLWTTLDIVNLIEDMPLEAAPESQEADGDETHAFMHSALVLPMRQEWRTRMARPFSNTGRKVRILRAGRMQRRLRKTRRKAR